MGFKTDRPVPDAEIPCDMTSHIRCEKTEWDSVTLALAECEDGTRATMPADATDVSGSVIRVNQNGMLFKFVWANPGLGHCSPTKFRLSVWNQDYPDIFLRCYGGHFYLSAEVFEDRSSKMLKCVKDPTVLGEKHFPVEICGLDTQPGPHHRMVYRSVDDSNLPNREYTFYLNTMLPSQIAKPLLLKQRLIVFNDAVVNQFLDTEALLAEAGHFPDLPHA